MHKIKLIGEIDSWGYARYNLEYAMRQVPEGEPLILEVDSLGGDVMEAISISNMLHERGNVTAHIVGFCASSATWLCYGCDKVVINNDCAYLIHNCSTFIEAWGSMTADEIDVLIEKLKSEKKSNEAIDLIIAKKYATHSSGKMDIKGVLKLMKEERWMLPEEALALGLVDEVSEDHVLSKSNYAARLHVINSMGTMPQLPEAFASAAKEEKKTITQRIKEAATGIFGGGKTAACGEKAATVTRHRETTNNGSGETTNNGEAGTTNGEENQPTVNMRKEYIFVNALLKRDALEEKDGKIVLSVEDIKAIDDRLKEADDRLKEADGLQERVNTLTTERDEAKQSLTDAETAIDGISDEIASLEGIDAKVAAVKDAIAKATNVQTVHAENEGNGHKEEDMPSDPVNQYVAQYKR